MAESPHHNPAPIAMPEGDAVHHALRDRGHPLDIRVTGSTPPGDETGETSFVENNGGNRFSLPMGQRRGVSRIMQMLQYHPQPAAIDGNPVPQESPTFDAARVYITGNAGHYPESLVSSRPAFRSHGCIIVDGVTYNYREALGRPHAGRLHFSYFTADATPDDQHPNCRHVRELRGTPGINAATHTADGEHPQATAHHDGVGVISVTHGRRGSPIWQQAQQQRLAVAEHHPPLPDDAILHQLWEPLHRHMDQQGNHQDNEYVAGRYFNVCILDHEDQAVHLQQGDERHNAAIAYALWRNPQLNLTPVMRRRHTVGTTMPSADTPKSASLEGAAAILHDGQRCDLMESPSDPPGFVRRVSSIELTIRVWDSRDHDTTVVAPAPIFFAGIPSAECIWVAPDCGMMPSHQALSCLIESAYWDEGWEMAGCEHHEQRRQRTDSLARRCIDGELAAFRVEVEQIALGFLPVAECPDEEMQHRVDLPNGGTFTVTYRPPPAQTPSS